MLSTDIGAKIRFNCRISTDLSMLTDKAQITHVNTGRSLFDIM